MKNIFPVILALLLMSFQCSKDELDPLAEQEVVFARIYENHAWGDQFEGWFIDNTGYMRGFSLSRNQSMDWINFSEAGFHSADEIFYNLAQSDTTFEHIHLSEIFRYYQLIDPASKGVLNEAVSEAYDMGQLSYYALQYFHDEKKYRWVLLRSEGDFLVSNTSREAEKICSWLKGIDPLVTPVP